MIIIEVFLYLMGYVNYLIMLLCIHVMIICIPRTCNLGLNHNTSQQCEALFITKSLTIIMSNNSNVYSCLLDACKAFDKVMENFWKINSYIIESKSFVLYYTIING